ncbi:hypothetical protein Dimus_009762 [Dionaea muscipula]
MPYPKTAIVEEEGLDRGLFQQRRKWKLNRLQQPPPNSMRFPVNELRSKRESHINSYLVLEEETMADILTEDLLVEILTRLPVKSLLRFRCVCKSWNSLITNSSFIKAHVRHHHHHHQQREGEGEGEQNSNTNPLLIVRNYSLTDRKERYSLCLDNETMDEIMEFHLPFSAKNHFFRLVGCIHGLVCLTDDIGKRADAVFLWNPVLGRSLTLPVPEPQISARDCQAGAQVYGFGCGRLTSEYKVVRVLYPGPDEKSDGSPCPPLPISVEIFRLSKGFFWEELELELQSESKSESESESDGHLPLLDGRQAYVNGVVHWLASSSSKNSMIVGFDVDAEVFREMKLPTALRCSRGGLDRILACWRGMLSAFEVQYPGDFCLWVMGQYGVDQSWTRRFVVESFGVPRRIRSLRKNGEVVVVDKGHLLLTYDPKTTQITDSGIQVNYAFHMKPYTESLVLLDSGLCMQVHGQTTGSVGSCRIASAL